MVFAKPRLAESEPVQMSNELDIAPQGHRRTLIRIVVRRHEDAVLQGIAAHWRAGAGCENDRQAAKSPDAHERPVSGRTRELRPGDALRDQVQPLLDLRAGDELTEADVHAASERHVAVALLRVLDRIRPGSQPLTDRAPPCSRERTAWYPSAISTSR
jgi:hypothetical protein